MKKDFLIICLLLVLAIPAVKELFIPGGFTSHDLSHHVVRQIDMDRLLSEGQFPPRWSGQLNNGYGYPLFLFNYPLPALLGEVFHKIGFNFVDSVKGVLFSSMILGELGMYLFLNAFLKSRKSAFLGSIFYLYAPIRFLNVYVSASVGSAMGLSIVPFVFWAMVKIGKKGLRGYLGILGGGIALAALILAHNVSAVIFAPILLSFAWVISPTSPRLRGVKGIGLMFMLGLGLSCWFWLPAVWEKQYIRFDEIYNGFFKDQFVSVWQLLHSPWGYGLSHPQNPELGDMSYQLGLVHILVMLILIPSLWFFRRIKEFKVIGGFVLASFLVSIFLMLKLSEPLWQTVPFLNLIQFPLRFQAISVFSASIAVALLVKHLPYKKLLVFSLLFLVIFANRNHWHINQAFNPPENYYLNLKTTATTYGEHLPKWGKIMDKPALGKLEFVQGLGEIRVIRDSSAEILAEVEASTSVSLRLNQFYFPGWQVKVDSKATKINYLNDGENYGLIIFDVDKGSHIVSAEFKNNIDRNLSDFVSLLGVILWIGLLCKLLVAV